LSQSDDENTYDTKPRAKVGKKIRESLDTIDDYLNITRSKPILRRYFVMNAFDGAMTTLGVVIGSYITNIDDPISVIGVILVSGVAMAISGFSGTYMTESAERSHSLHALEDAMLVDLEMSDFGKATKVVSLFSALVDGTAPFLASLPCILPFFLALIGLLPIHIAFFSSIVASLVVLFVLGFYLGRISEKNVLVSGIKMVIAGTVVALIAIILGSE
jgi:predicted membrane protein (TIGR00267 family)